MSKPDSLEKLFQKHANEHLIDPSARSWDRIEQRLHRPKPQIVWARRLAAAVLLTLIGLAAFYTTRTEVNTLAQAPEAVELLPNSLQNQSTTSKSVPYYQAIDEGTNERDLVVRNTRQPQLMVSPSYRVES